MSSKNRNSALWCTVWTVMVFSLFPVVLSQLPVETEYDFGNFRVLKPFSEFRLKCSINETGFQFQWQKDGLLINDKTIKENFDGHTSELVILYARHKHTGIYKCVAEDVNATLQVSAEINVISLPTANMKEDITLIEGDTLTLDCQPAGVPLPLVYWIVGNTSYTESVGRVQLLPNNNSIANAILQIENIQKTDRAEYKCVMSSAATQGDEVIVTVFVRVRDKLAVLWPVIGIVVQLVILMIFLCIYEKMNPESVAETITKKRENKTISKVNNDRVNSSRQDSRL